MLSAILRNSCSRSSSVVLRRGSVAVFNAIETLLRHPSSGESVAAVPGNGAFGGDIRSFQSKPGRLDFRASYASQAGYAAAPASPSVDDDGLDIASLGIDKSIVSALASRGIHKLFPIQRAVLEPAMQGRDMIGRARTGTGKTLAFGVPILDKIIQYNAKHGRGRNPLALVMAPTRELASQVEKEFRLTAPNLDTICCYGGTPIGSQIRSLRYGVDVVVGTPGRIIDLLNRGALNLSEVQFVVLDEADQMLAVGFEEAVETILQQLPQKRQSMMFSATMPPPIRKLTRKYLSDPLTIDLVGEDDQKLAEGISLFSIASDNYAKASILGPLITEHAKGGKCIVFTQTKRDADRLSYAMGRKYKCEALHGDISQNHRERTLSGFREGHFNILIATDVASRGLDIPNVDLVIHYELPNTSEIFVHRSGRTGRAGKKGSAILIHTDQQARDVRMIERDIGSRFTQLPRIEVRGEDMIDVGGGGRSGSFGGGQRDRFGDGFGRGERSSGFGRSSGGGYGRSSGFGGSGSGQSGGRFDGFGDFGSKRSGGGFGDFGSKRSGGGFGDFGSKGSGGSFGDFGSKRSGGGFGDFGSKGSSGGFGDFGSKGSGGGFGGFGR